MSAIFNQKNIQLPPNIFFLHYFTKENVGLKVLLCFKVYTPNLSFMYAFHQRQMYSQTEIVQASDEYKLCAL